MKRIHFIGIILLGVFYITLSGYFVFINERTQKEIGANFHGVNVESDGKGAFPNTQKPYVCVEKDANLTYAHECTLDEWVGKLLIRFIIALSLSWFWFFMRPMRLVILVACSFILFYLFYFFEKKKLHKRYDNKK